MCASSGDEVATSLDASDRDPSTAVAFAVAEATNEPVTDLPPLSAAIDPGALDRLFASAAPSSALEIAFHYYGFEVTVAGEGRIEVVPAARSG